MARIEDEQDIFNAAEDDGGTAAPQAARPEVDDDDAGPEPVQTETQPPAQGETTQPVSLEDQPAPRRVPLRELLDARERAQKAEQAQQELARRLEHLERERQKASQKPAEPVEAPDMFLDPDGYRAYVESQIEQRVRAVEEQRDLRDTARAFKVAEKTHGDLWPKAWQAFNAAATASPALQQAFLAVDPSDRGEEIVSWYRQQEVLREVGSDPTAYEKRMRERLLADPEFLQAAMERAQQAAPQAAPSLRTVTRLPPSLNARQGGSTRPAAGAVDYGSDDEIWASGNAKRA